MTAVSPGAGAAPAQSSARGTFHSAEVDRVAASLMLPRLAAFGPAVHLGGWRAQQAMPAAPRWGWSQVAVMAATTVLGLSALLVPVSVLVYTAGELASAKAALSEQQVPTSVVPVVEPNVLTPALGQP